MKLSTFLIALVAMFGAFGFLTWQRLNFDVERELSAHAEDINSSAPIFINAGTDMIGARAEEKEITYMFRLHGWRPKDIERQRDNLLEEKISRARENENFMRFLKSGVHLSYEYFIGDELALRFSIDESLAKSAEKS